MESRKEANTSVNCVPMHWSDEGCGSLIRGQVHRLPLWPIGKIDISVVSTKDGDFEIFAYLPCKKKIGIFLLLEHFVHTKM